MTNPSASASLSVRGEAQRTTGPDEAQVFATVTATADSKSAAMSEVQFTMTDILADLARLGGAALTTETTARRADLVSAINPDPGRVRP